MSNNTNSVGSLQSTINKKAEDRLRKDLFALYNGIRTNRLLNKHSGNKVPEIMIVNAMADLTEVRNITGDHNEATGNVFRAVNQKNIDIVSVPGILFMHSEGTKIDSNNVSAYMKELFNYWLPFYIEEETKEFIERIDKIQDDVDYLNGSVANLECNQHH